MDDAAVAWALLGRGGRLQQDYIAEEMDEVMGDAPPGDEHCPLVEALLYLMGWGTLSLPNISWLARCAIASPTAHEELTIIAELGAHGEHPGNMRRGLFRSSLMSMGYADAKTYGTHRA